MNFEEMMKYADPGYVASLRPDVSNETVIVDGCLPKTWKCPHCDKVNRFDRYADDIFMHHGRVIRNCDRCTWLHT